ncbi:MAG TPA: glycosyltransferase [Streptosporangiaceae bacterium]|jgi:GT2 family glycosyltransferase
MRVDLVIAAYNSGQALEDLVASARSHCRCEVRVRLFLHSEHAPTVASCERVAETDGVIYHAFGQNRGLSRSWNDGILDAYADGSDVVIVVNDDIRFGEGNVDTIAACAMQLRDRYIISCAGWHLLHSRVLPSHGFACFAINPIALEVIGCFDENFFPAYCEDQDYARRAYLAGLPEGNCADTAIVHAGSATIRRDQTLAHHNQRTQGENMHYYRRKWGGDPGDEQFAQPFGDPGLGVFISPERRHRPYGVHDRSERDPADTR